MTMGRARCSLRRVARDLEKRGQRIGPMDMTIAAHALSLDATLVTHHTHDFARVKGLRLKDWVA